MGRSRILLAGESWVTTATHIKGFDQFPTVTFHRGADALAEALADSDFALTYMPAPRGADALSVHACRAPGIRRRHSQRHRRQHPAPASRYLDREQAHGEPAQAHSRLRGRGPRPDDGRRLLQLSGHQRGRPIPGNAGRGGAARHDPALGRPRRGAGGIPSRRSWGLPPIRFSRASVPSGRCCWATTRSRSRRMRSFC